MTYFMRNDFYQSLKPCHLGPYETGGTPLTGGAKPLHTSVKLLAQGINQNKVISIVPVSLLEWLRMYIGIRIPFLFLLE